GPAAPTASTRRSTTPRPGFPRAPRSRWFAPIWRTTRAWWSSRSRTSSTTARCVRVSMPSPSSRPPSCFSKKERPETWRSRGHAPDSYEVTFSEDRAEIVRRDGAIGTTLQVIVSPEDDAEVRRVSLTNFGTKSRAIELTSYAEVVLAPPAADAAHPTFSNLSVETECVPELDTLLATRRPRSRSETQVWLAHV